MHVVTRSVAIRTGPSLAKMSDFMEKLEFVELIPLPATFLACSVPLQTSLLPRVPLCSVCVGVDSEHLTYM